MEQAVVALINFAIEHYGLGVAVVLAVIFAPITLVIAILQWVVKRQEKLDAAALSRERDCQDSSSTREERLLKIIDSRDAALADHNKTTADFRAEVKTAQGFQRQEHEQMTGAIKDLTLTIHRLLEVGR